MTPFIIWLKKDEIDDLLSTLITKNTSTEITNNIYNMDELLDLSHNVMDQNRKLIKLLEKVEPLNPIQKKAALVHGISQKCNHYQEQYNYMKAHCSTYNHNNSTRNTHDQLNIDCKGFPINF